MNKINSILQIINSKRDRAGNCYWAFRYTLVSTGEQVYGTVCGGESNIRGILFEMNGGNWEPRDTYIECKELPIREFDRMVKDWPHAGCSPKDLCAFVRKGLGL